VETTADTAEAERTVDAGHLVGYLKAAFPWYGLDEAFTGPRWLSPVGTSADGTVEHGSVGHGDQPSVKVEPTPDTRRFAVVVSVADLPVRRSADGTGVLDAGLLSRTWPTMMERHLRQDWLDQQTAIAWDLADALDGPGWSSLTLPVDGLPTPFHYRESDYGWVLAGSARGLHLGAYGRGMSAYGLGLAAIKDIAAYAR
jgi:hypothetical protein